MGYRSEVAVAIKKDDYEKFLKGNIDFEDLINMAHKNSNGEIVILYWDWIKWYPDYKDISLFNYALSYIAEQGHPYTFVRIGEDMEDIEYIENGGEESEYLGEYIHPITYIERPVDWENIE